MTQTRKVILFIESSRGFGRALMRGIARYASMFGPWTFYYRRFFYQDKSISAKARKTELLHLKKWGADGIIARELSTHTKEEILSLGLPIVFSSVFDEALMPNAGNIYVDNYGIGKMGAEHLLERGFRNYAFCGIDDFFWSRERSIGFVDAITKRNYNLYLYKYPQSKKKRLWDSEQYILKEWLRNLPKPIGLMACIDERAQEIIQACREEGIKIPEDIAIVSGDNDEVICELSNPQLSSVAINGEGAGFEAAHLLDKLMSCKAPKNTTVTVHPTIVVTRQSSDIFAIQDKDVVAALEYIRNNNLKPLQVSDVAQYVAMTRQGLNKKFHACIGRSIHSEIIRNRINIAKKMLIETNMSISNIAYRMNFDEIKQLSRLFKNQTGFSPLQYRQKFTKL